MGFPIRVKSFTISNHEALPQLGEQFSLQNGELAQVEGWEHGEAFVYQDQTWIKLKPVRTVVNRTILNTLTLTQTGNIVQLADGGEGKPTNFIYSGKEWMSLGPVSQVADLAQRDGLPAQAGDVVKVTQTQEGKPGSFFICEWSLARTCSWR